MPIKITNTATGTVWTFSTIRKASRELHIDSRYITDYCKGKKKFHSGVYEWCFVNDVKGDFKSI